MTRSHNIVGCEASDRERLVAFSHAHGSIRTFPRPPRRVPLAAALLLAAALWVALIGGAALLTKH